MSVIAALRNLQRVDSQVRALSTRLDGAADALAAREREVTTANAKLAEAESIHRQLLASAKNLEAESGSFKARIELLRQELNATSKKAQYDTILAEMGTLQEKRDELDGQALEFMTKADAQQVKINDATAHRDERVRRRDAAKAEHDQRRADIADRLAELRREREEAAVQVPAKELELFNAVADEHARAGVGGVDDVPRCAGALGGAAHGVGEAGKAVVVAVAFPVLGGDAPGGALVVFEFVEAGALVVLGEVKPDFDDENAVGGELVLEARDAAQGGVEFGEVARVAGIFAEGLGVPAAGVDGHASTGRKAAPETPHGGPFAFFVGGLFKGKGFDAARIEPGVEDVDDVALAGGADAGNDHEDGERRILQLHLHMDEVGAYLGDAVVVGFFGQARFGVGFGHARKGVAAGAGVVEPSARRAQILRGIVTKRCDASVSGAVMLPCQPPGRRTAGIAPGGIAGVVAPEGAAGRGLSESSQ